MPAPAATTIIVGHDAAVAEWVRRQLARPGLEFGSCTAIGIARGSDLVAGIVFNGFHWPSIEASIASTTPAWCSRRNLSAIFAYPFRQLRCTRVGASTEATNQPVRAFLCRLGFREEGLLHQASPPSAANPAGDVVLYGMTPTECRWLPLLSKTPGPRPGRQGNDVERSGFDTADG